MKEDREKIEIVGRGNVATHLYEALKGRGDVRLINPHTLEELRPDADLVLISVTDNAIEEVAKKIASKIEGMGLSGEAMSGPILAHTSGSIPMGGLNAYEGPKGVFYPLQTFTKGVELNYGEMPVFIEGSTMEIERELERVASYFTNHISRADSEQRKQLHLASVFACNFSNALAGVAFDLLQDCGLDFKALLPLMAQTVKKLEKLSPKEAQTGPAKRGDTKVINQHLAMLKDKPEIEKIYQKITELIIKAL